MLKQGSTQPVLKLADGAGLPLSEAMDVSQPKDGIKETGKRVLEGSLRAGVSSDQGESHRISLSGKYRGKISGLLKFS